MITFLDVYAGRFKKYSQLKKSPVFIFLAGVFSMNLLGHQVYGQTLSKNQIKNEFRKENHFSCLRKFKNSKGETSKDQVQVSFHVSMNQKPDYLKVTLRDEFGDIAQESYYIRTLADRPLIDETMDIPKVVIKKVGTMAVSYVVGSGVGTVLSEILGSAVVVTIVRASVSEVVRMNLNGEEADGNLFYVKSDQGSSSISHGSWEEGEELGHLKFLKQMGFSFNKSNAALLCQLDAAEAALQFGFKPLNLK